jgi:hypothetical protein
MFVILDVSCPNLRAEGIPAGQKSIVITFKFLLLQVFSNNLLLAPNTIWEMKTAYFLLYRMPVPDYSFMNKSKLVAYFG